MWGMFNDLMTKYVNYGRKIHPGPDLPYTPHMLTSRTHIQMYTSIHPSMSGYYMTWDCVLDMLG